MKNAILSGLGGGLGWGIGMGIAIGVSSLAGGGLRPVVKGALKGGLWAKERATVLAAEARERAEDLYYEARSERDAEQALLNGETVPVLVHPAGNGAGRSTSTTR